VISRVAMPPGAEDIPFLGPNATVGQFSAIFWIETVEYDGRQFLQLQYTQTVLLNFADLSWPHVSVATSSRCAWLSPESAGSTPATWLGPAVRSGS
jgi:hypothetical protein